MNEPLLTLGSFYLTPVSIALFFGAVLSAGLLNLLAIRAKIKSESALLLTLLSICFGLFFGHLLFSVLQLYNEPYSYEQPVAFLLNPAWGGFTFVGVLAGAFLACMITAKVERISFGKLASILVPALMLLIAVVRFAEPIEELGKGPEASSSFFPFSYTPNPEYDDVRRVPAFFYEGLFALFLVYRSVRGRESRVWASSLIMFISGQMFFEVFRQDIYTNYMSLITFVRINQLMYVLILAAIMILCTIIAVRKSGKLRIPAIAWTVFAVSVGACVGLQFLFDKPIHFFEENIFFADWLVYVLLAFSAFGMGWAALKLLSESRGAGDA